MSKPSLSLEYNSTRENLIYPEYGRFIQKLVQHCKTVADKKERQAVAETIIEMMQQMNPPAKNVNEYKDRLWRHFFKMANYDIDVDVPGAVIPTEENTRLVPVKVPYLQHNFNWRHYGYLTRVMINKALKMEDGPIKQGYVEAILSYMKLSYRTWNKEHFVNDEIIKSDLGVISERNLHIDEDHTIENLVRNITFPQPVTVFNKNNKNNKNHGNQNKNKPKSQSKSNFKPNGGSKFQTNKK